MWGSRLLVDYEEIDILRYEKYLLSWKIKNCDDEISRLNVICGRYEANQPGSNCEWKKEFDVQCGDLVEKAHKSRRKLVEMEIEWHEVVLEENPKVRSVDIFSKSEPTRVEEITRVQMDSCFSLRLESLNSKGVTMNAWEHMLLYIKFMEFLPNKRKKNDDIFFLSY